MKDEQISELLQGLRCCGQMELCGSVNVGGCIDSRKQPTWPTSVCFLFPIFPGGGKISCSLIMQQDAIHFSARLTSHTLRYVASQDVQMLVPSAGPDSEFTSSIYLHKINKSVHLQIKIYIYLH